MREPRPPPITLWGRRSGGFLKEPVYWCRKEWTLWADGGRPFLTMGSVDRHKTLVNITIIPINCENRKRLAISAQGQHIRKRSENFQAAL